MYFTFKDQYEDFIVEEKLDYTPNGIWDAWHLFIEKKGMNTMDIISHLTSNLPLKREDIGIAGLKDKEGVDEEIFENEQELLLLFHCFSFRLEYYRFW